MAKSNLKKSLLTPKAIIVIIVVVELALVAFISFQRTRVSTETPFSEQDVEEELMQNEETR